MSDYTFSQYNALEGDIPCFIRRLNRQIDDLIKEAVEIYPDQLNDRDLRIKKFADLASYPKTKRADHHYLSIHSSECGGPTEASKQYSTYYCVNRTPWFQEKEAAVPDERFDSEPGVFWSKLRNDGYFAVFDWPSDIPIKRGLSETNANMIIKRIEGKDSEWKDIKECDRITFRLRSPSGNPP